MTQISSSTVTTLSHALVADERFLEVVEVFDSHVRLRDEQMEENMVGVRMQSKQKLDKFLRERVVVYHAPTRSRIVTQNIDAPEGSLMADIRWWI